MSLARLLSGLLLLGALIAGASLWLQRQAAEELRGEIALLRDERREIATLQAQRTKLLAAQPATAELERLRADHAAVERLRGEIAALRRRAEERERAAQTKAPSAAAP